MNISFTACYYHPGKAAVFVCERCRRPICLEDKCIFKEERPRGFYSYFGILRSITTVNKFDFCILCNASMLKLKANSSKDSLKFLPIIGLLFLIVSFYLFKNANGFLLIGITGFILAIFCLGIIASVINNLAQANVVKSDVLNLLMNSHIQNNSSTKFIASFESHNTRSRLNSNFQNVARISSKNDSVFSLTCYKCGSNLTLQDKFCQNCGNSTHEELINFYKDVKEEFHSSNS